MCGVWGDPPTAPSGGDSCQQFTEGDTPSSLLYCSHHLEGGRAVDWRRGVSRLVSVDGSKGVLNGWHRAHTELTVSQ